MVSLGLFRGGELLVDNKFLMIWFGVSLFLVLNVILFL